MAIWKCKSCGRQIIARHEIVVCGECRTKGITPELARIAADTEELMKTVKPLKSPLNKMVDTDEIKTK